MDNIDNDYIIIKNEDLYNYIYKFTIDGKIEKCNKDIINIANDSKIYNDTFISYFDIQNLITDIMQKSYSNKNKILEQFDKDYYRQNIILNNNSYSKENFLAIINNYDILNKNLNLTYDEIIILLCCQSTYELPYKLLYNIYKIDCINNILTCDSKDIGSAKININILEQDKITIELSNKFLIKNIEDDKILKKIYLSLNIELKMENINKNEPIICIFSWKYENL